MAGKWIKNTAGIKITVVGVLCLLFLIPFGMIQDLISEREGRRNDTIFEINDKWGEGQVLNGPILTVPFKEYFKDEKNNLVTRIEHAHFLPDTLSVEGNLDTEIRYRSIYQAVLYNTQLQIKGKFPSPNFDELSIPQENILWEEAFLSIGISDMKGIKEEVDIHWNDAKLPASPGSEAVEILSAGISTSVPLQAQNTGYEYSLDLKLAGSTLLMFTPVAKVTLVNLNSTWNNPSFRGEFLPIKREISEKGFQAQWKVFHLNRNYPQQWTGERSSFCCSSFGVNILIPVNTYQKTTRSAKYAIMFIGLTFLAFFMIEIIGKKPVHPIQYLLIGFALILFYTLLLSISEYTSFDLAYLGASLAVILLISIYTRSVLDNNRFALVILGVLTLLYLFLYTILQLQDFALLLGSFGLFLVLAIVMFLTRKIDWYSSSDQERTSKES